MGSIKLKNITVTYDKHPAVHHISGEFAKGSLTAIVGPNGAGKSSLLKCLAGVIEPSEGQIDFAQIKRSEIAYLPQAADVDRSFPINIMQYILSGLWAKRGATSAISKSDFKKARHALETVGLKDFENRYINQLSSGQFQRVLFARVLLQDAKLILLDEPFTAIDDDTSKHLLEQIGKWHKQHKTIICVLHDVAQIKAHFPNCVLLARELISWGDTHTALSAKNRLKARFFEEAWGNEEELCHVHDHEEVKQ